MKKGLIIAGIGIIILGAILGVLSVLTSQKSKKEFVASGYILDPSQNVNLTDDAYTLINFTQGKTYREKYGTTIYFSDSNGNSQTLTPEHFMHYESGSLGAFTKGAIVDVSSFGEENYSYYTVSKNTTLTKNGSDYQFSYGGEDMSMTEFLWKLSDTEYMLVSPTITLKMGDQNVEFEDYLQITYVDNGIVRLSHQDGTYQTVSDESTLTTSGGATLNLVGKGFYDGDELVLALDNLAVDDSSYLAMDEDDDSTSSNVNIPNFVVEEGEDGESGTYGDSGDSGTDGSAGSKGSSGAEGTLGEDGDSGNSGASGVAGDTGAEGYQGKNAENSSSASNIESADVKARPTVSLNTLSSSGEEGEDAGSTYSVTSTSATMTITLDDSGESLVRSQNTTLVHLYNRATMEEVLTEEEQKSYGQKLEDKGTVDLSFDNLDADTEYLLTVEAEYMPENDITYQATIFNKIFKTNEMGIGIDKYEVGENYVTVKTSVDNALIKGYSVIFYKYNDSGTEQDLLTYVVSTDSSGKAPGTTLQLIANPTAPSADNITMTVNSSGYTIDSDTTYYAKIADLKVTGVSDTKSYQNIDESVALTTLKRKPYYKVSGVNYDFTQMQTTLSVNKADSSLIVELPYSVVDQDAGISCYTYNLYNKEDYEDYLDKLANESGNTSSATMPTPVYSKTTASQSSVSFTLDSANDKSYYANVVITFDNNESEVNYQTLMSDCKELDSFSSAVSVDFVESNQYTVGVSTGSSGKTYEDSNGKTLTYPDKALGYIRIYDPNYETGNDTNSVIKLSATYPLTISIIGQYADTKTVTTSTIDKDENGYRYIPYSFDTLHASSYYTITVSGAYDTDGDGAITDAEKNTYLAGLRFTTGSGTILGLYGVDNSANSNAAFSTIVGVTSCCTVANMDRSTSDYEVLNSYANYGAGILESITFQLSQTSEDGTSTTVLGKQATITDQAAESDTHDSAFQKFYIVRNATGATTGLSAKTENGKYYGLWMDSLSTFESEKGTTNKYTLKNYVLTPESFGLDADAAVFSSGGTFNITVVKAVDYTGAEIPFYTATTGDGTKDENTISFTIQQQHRKSSTHNTDVTAETFTNADRTGTTYYQSDLKDDTVIGMTLSTNYLYTDYGQMGMTRSDFTVSGTEEVTALPESYMVYTIYKYTGSETAETIDGNGSTIEARDIYLKDSDTIGQYLDPVLVGITNRKEDIDLYFEGTKSVNTGESKGQKTYWFVPNGDSKADRIASLDDFENTRNLSNLTQVKASDNKTVLERGNQYIVAYHVVTDDEINCVSGAQYASDEYPYCTYKLVQSSAKTGSFDAAVTISSGTLPASTAGQYSIAIKDMVPLYRSTLVKLEKQTPIIERYPYDSDNNSVTYMYRIDDPDETLIRNAAGDIVITVERFASYNAASHKDSFEQTIAKSDIASYSNTFKELKIGGETGKKLTTTTNYDWFSVTFQYKTTDNGSAVAITSARDQFKGLTSKDSSNCGIRVQGVKSSTQEDSSTNVKDSGTYYEKAAQIENGYNVALSVIGTSLNTMAAYRVTLTAQYLDTTDDKYKNVTSNGKDLCVVYDPVYISDITTIKDSSDSQGILNLKTEPIKTVLDKAKELHSSTTIRFVITCQAYYATGQVGFKNFKSASTAYQTDKTSGTTSLDGENLYALKIGTVNADTNAISWYYQYSSSDTEVTMASKASGTLTQSLIIPGSASDQVGMTITTPSAIEESQAELSMRLPFGALSEKLLTSESDYSINKLVFSSNNKTDSNPFGLGINGFGKNNRVYNVEKLATVDVPITISDDQYITFDDILPATKEISSDSGLVALNHTIQVVGTGPTDNNISGAGNYPLIYAAVYQGTKKWTEQAASDTYTLMEITRTTDSIDGTTYFTLGSVLSDESAAFAADGFYGKDRYANYIVPVSTTNTSLRNFILRGLQKDTYYKIRYFTYGSDGSVKDLYSVTKKSDTSIYYPKTLDTIAVEVGTPEYVYSTYDNKYANISFGVKNSEGSGITINYTLTDPTTENVVSSGTAQKLGSGSYQYYGSISVNPPLAFQMNPGSGPLEYGKTYKITVTAIDDSSGQTLSSDSKQFTVPIDLQKPSFYVVTSTKAISDDYVTVSANIRSTDVYNMITSDTYQVQIYKGATLLESQDIKRNEPDSDGTTRESVKMQTQLEAGKQYTFKVVANIDADNDGDTSDDTPITYEEIINASTSVSAKVNASYSGTILTMNFTNTSNMVGVNKIIFTVFDSNGSKVSSHTFENTFVTTDGASFSVNWDETLTDGTYTIQWQYYKSETLAGNDNQTLEVTNVAGE